MDDVVNDEWPLVLAWIAGDRATARWVPAAEPAIQYARRHLELELGKETTIEWYGDDGRLASRIVRRTAEGYVSR